KGSLSLPELLVNWGKVNEQTSSSLARAITTAIAIEIIRQKI